MVRTYYTKPPLPVSSPPQPLPPPPPDPVQHQPVNNTVSNHLHYPSPLSIQIPVAPLVQQTPFPAYHHHPPYYQSNYYPYLPPYPPWWMYPPYVSPPPINNDNPYHHQHPMIHHQHHHPYPIVQQPPSPPSTIRAPTPVHSTVRTAPIHAPEVQQQQQQPVQRCPLKSALRPASRNGRVVMRAESTKDVRPDDNCPPWTMGNPQPKTGRRGTQNWNLGQSGRKASVDYGVTVRQEDISPLDLQATSESPGPSFYSLRSVGSAISLDQLTNNLSMDDEKNRHKADLLQQIEDNKRMKQLQKQRELEYELQELKKLEQYNAKQQAEMNEEERKQRERAQALERKQQRQQQQPQNNHNEFNKVNQRPPPVKASRPETPPETPPPRREWWERKEDPTVRKGKSAIVPTLRSKPPTGDSPPRSRGSATPTRKSRLSYQPSAVARHRSESRNEGDNESSSRNGSADSRRPETTDSQKAFYEREAGEHR